MYVKTPLETIKKLTEIGVGYDCSCMDFTGIEYRIFFVCLQSIIICFLWIIVGKMNNLGVLK